MFSGIIEDLGKVKKISPNGDMTSIIIQSNLFLSDHKMAILLQLMELA